MAPEPTLSALVRSGQLVSLALVGGDDESVHYILLNDSDSAILNGESNALEIRTDSGWRQVPR